MQELETHAVDHGPATAPDLRASLAEAIPARATFAEAARRAKSASERAADHLSKAASKVQALKAARTDEHRASIEGTGERFADAIRCSAPLPVADECGRLRVSAQTRRPHSGASIRHLKEAAAERSPPSK
jgi:hypothetical protein